MLKNNRSAPASLRKKRNLMNLEDYDTRSFFIIGMILMVFIVSIILAASSPNSNMLFGA